MSNKQLLKKEYDFYKSNEDEFIKKYNGKFIVIKNREVIGIYNSRIDAYSKTQEEHEIGTFLIQHCVKETKKTQASFYSYIIS